HDGERTRRRPARREPAEGQLERRMRIGRDRAIDLLVARELGGRWRLVRRWTGEERQLWQARIDPVDAGARIGELRGQRRTRGRVLRSAQQPTRQRLPLDEVHDEERRAEDGRIVLAPADTRDGKLVRRGGAEERELVAPARLQMPPGRVAA